MTLYAVRIMLLLQISCCAVWKLSTTSLSCQIASHKSGLERHKYISILSQFLEFCIYALEPLVSVDIRHEFCALCLLNDGFYLS